MLHLRKKENEERQCDNGKNVHVCALLLSSFSFCIYNAWVKCSCQNILTLRVFRFSSKFSGFFFVCFFFHFANPLRFVHCSIVCEWFFVLLTRRIINRWNQVAKDATNG